MSSEGEDGGLSGEVEVNSDWGKDVESMIEEETEVGGLGIEDTYWKR